VFIRRRAKLDFLDFNDDLFFLRFVRFLFLFVQKFAEINDATDGRFGLRRDFDQVVTALTRKIGGLLRRHDANHLSIFVNDANLAATNAFVDPHRWPALISALRSSVSAALGTETASA
jgi:hypothetical protein